MSENETGARFTLRRTPEGSAYAVEVELPTGRVRGAALQGACGVEVSWTGTQPPAWVSRYVEQAAKAAWRSDPQPRRITRWRAPPER